MDRWDADRAAMLRIPPVTPPTGGASTPAGRDHYIRVDTSDYSVHPRALGRTVMVRADNEEVTVIAGNDVVARHTCCWARYQSLTDPDHAAAAHVLRGMVIHQPAARAATACAAALAPTASASRSSNVNDLDAAQQSGRPRRRPSCAALRLCGPGR
ncbi:Mu transposase domain-containing protein [Streptomyces sp. NPDC088337]|uniref:Mu transposase domain-containing protein n=1 Tax=unclassified Streptomyces TaxID=2593676 RepID=UPI00381D8B4F